MMEELIIRIAVNLPVAIFTAWLAIHLYKKRQRLQEMKFLRGVAMKYPEARVSFFAVDTTSEAAIEEVKTMLEESMVSRPNDELTWSRNYRG